MLGIIDHATTHIIGIFPKKEKTIDSYWLYQSLEKASTLKCIYIYFQNILNLATVNIRILCTAPHTQRWMANTPKPIKTSRPPQAMDRRRKRTTNLNLLLTESRKNWSNKFAISETHTNTYTDIRRTCRRESVWNRWKFVVNLHRICTEWICIESACVCVLTICMYTQLFDDEFTKNHSLKYISWM